MINISYSFYTDTYGGSSIDESNFNFILNKAIGIVNGIVNVDLFKYVEGTLDIDLENRLKTAICAGADVVNSAGSSGGQDISGVLVSESVAGAWSKTYAQRSGVVNSEMALRQDIRSVVEDYLSGTDLIFKGCWLCV